MTITAPSDTKHQRLALVTGGTRGIGREISLELQEAGYKVVANYGGNDERARQFHDETEVPISKFDVGDFAACEAAVGAITAEYGPIDILINNAGITRDGTLSKMTPDDWNDVIRTNLTGCFNLAKLTFPSMKARNFGRIVNIGSVNGQTGQYGQVNYAAAKSGIHGFTKALALEGAKNNVTVNAVAPGYVDTDMVRAVPADVLQKIINKIPVKRLGRAQDISRAVLFLVDEDADFVTGATLSVNGGHHMY